MTHAPGTPGFITETNVETPVRDGTVLRADIARPDDGVQHPALLMRTPYGKGIGGYETFLRAGYAVMVQDTRGRNASDGTYVTFTVPDTGDAEDGYDTVEWLAAQPWCDGAVGTFGPSYASWMQWELARLRPPSLKALVAYSIPLELTDVDWPGAFRPARRIRWWVGTIAPDLRRRAGMPPPHDLVEAARVWNEHEHGRWLGLLPWVDIVDFLPPGLAEHANAWLRKPNARPWRFDQVHKEVEVPNLDFSGWYDHCNGTMDHQALMQKNGRTELARTQTKLINGPWSHVTLGARKIGDVDFGPQAGLDLQQVMVRWFDRWLKGIENGVDGEPAVRYFVMGSGAWKSANTWPPEPVGTLRLHLSSGGDAANADGDGALSETQGTSSQPVDRYTYDPRDPVPTLWSRELFTEPTDRRKLEYRSDILYYRTEPLERDVETVGYPRAVLHVSSTSPDTDFFARLVDEPPDDGPALEVCYGMVRLRHRNSLDREDLVTPGEVVTVEIRLGATACRFLKGHRIRLEITSSDFPNHDRNHNTGGNDLLEKRMVTAEQGVHHSAERSSYVELPLGA